MPWSITGHCPRLLLLLLLQLLPSDRLEVFWFQAKRLFAARKVRVAFPAYYGSAIINGLLKDPLGVDVARHSQFYFELGEQLCNT